MRIVNIRMVLLMLLLLPLGIAEAAGKVYNIPFSDDFGSSNHLSDFVILDGNNDGNKWRLNTTWNIFGGDRSLEEMRMTTAYGADDWLVTPALHLEAGYVYAVSFSLRCGDYRYSEKMEVCLGTEPTIESLATKVIEPFSFTNYEYETYTKDFFVSVAGDYRLAFHAISNAGSSDIFLDNLNVKISATPQAPGQITDLTITPDPAGQHLATLNFTAPAKTISGEDLASLTKIDVIRNRTVVGTISNPAVGSAIQYIDQPVPNGLNTYSIVAYNANGKGISYDSDPVYVGVDVPKAPSGATISDNGNSLTIRWEPSGSVGEHGMVVNPSAVTYSIQEYDYAGDISNRIYMGSETSFTFDYNTLKGDPDVAKWAIMAHSDAGVSAITNVRIVVGKLYRLPYIETFRLAKRSTLVWTEQSGRRSFNLTSAACSDGGSVCFIPYADGDESALCLGKISLRGSANPMLTFNYKAAAGSTINVVAFTADGHETPLATYPCEGETAFEDWNVGKLSLQSLLSENYVVLKFRVKGMAESPVFIDNIRVGELYPVDLDVQLSAPEEVEWGDEITLNVTVNNVGDETVDDFEILIKATSDDYEAPLQVLDIVEPLPSMASAAYSFTLPSQSIPADYVSITAEVRAAGDLLLANNTMTAIVGIANNLTPPDAISTLQQATMPYRVYSLDGRCVLRDATNLDALPAGLYIINNRVVKK